MHLVLWTHDDRQMENPKNKLIHYSRFYRLLYIVKEFDVSPPHFITFCAILCPLQTYITIIYHWQPLSSDPFNKCRFVLLVLPYWIIYNAKWGADCLGPCVTCAALCPSLNGLMLWYDYHSLGTFILFFETIWSFANETSIDMNFHLKLLCNYSKWSSYSSRTNPTLFKLQKLNFK
jgi:hypothetical protein